MATTASLARNEKRKRLTEKYASKRKELKAILLSPETTDAEFFLAQKKLAKLPRNSSKIRIRNRCAITGRPRGFLGRYGLSRLTFRELALSGKIPGVTKSSW